MSAPVPPLNAAFVSQISEMLGPETPAFLRAMEDAPALALRLNPRRADAAAFAGDFSDGAVPWEANGRYLRRDESLKPGGSIAHAAGAFYLQEASAMASAAALDARPGERILDLCAAPGGKSTQIAAALGDAGLLVSNDPEPGRARALAGNLERMGVPNAIVVSELPAKLADAWPERFDAILVDAPCSGEGMFRRDPQSRAEWSPASPEGCARRQAGILDCAARMLRPGGRLVYSTCTFNRPENEGSILGFLDRHPDFSPEDFALSGVGPSEGGMLRLWPHRLRGDGHFVARLRKAGAPGEAKAPGPKVDREAAELLSGLCREACLTIPAAWRFSTARPGQRENLLPARRGDRLFLLSADAPDTAGLRVVSPGLCVARIGRSHIEPEHALAMALPPRLAQRRVLLPDAQALAFLRGEALHAAGDRGWTLVTWRGLPLGWGKAVDGTLKNHLPKGLRRLG